VSEEIPHEPPTRRLHLHPGARQVLRGGLGVGAAVLDRVRRREPPGPLTIGHFFDTIGRKMITATYLLSGLLLAVSAVLFNALNAVGAEDSGEVAVMVDEVISAL
jgi:hypothetical protein